jgi:hypothetical protein
MSQNTNNPEIELEYRLAETTLERYIAIALKSKTEQNYRRANNVLISAELTISQLPTPFTKVQKTEYNTLVAKLLDRVTEARNEVNYKSEGEKP